MSSRAIAVLGLLLCLAAQIEAGTIKVKWAGAQHKLSASLPRSRGYYFSASDKYMKVGDQAARARGIASEEFKKAIGARGGAPPRARARPALAPPPALLTLRACS
jgi:hypothetical protein